MQLHQIKWRYLIQTSVQQFHGKNNLNGQKMFCISASVMVLQGFPVTWNRLHKVCQWFGTHCGWVFETEVSCSWGTDPRLSWEPPLLPSVAPWPWAGHSITGALWNARDFSVYVTGDNAFPVNICRMIGLLLERCVQSMFSTLRKGAEMDAHSSDQPSG